MKKIKELYTFLTKEEPDKGKHFIVGIILAIIALFGFVNFFRYVTEWDIYTNKSLSIILTGWTVWGIAFIKEWIDEDKGGVHNAKDVKWTLIGGALGVILSIFFI